MPIVEPCRRREPDRTALLTYLLTYSGSWALRNRHIKKYWREVSQKSLRNRGVPPPGALKNRLRTQNARSLSRREEHPLVLLAVVARVEVVLGGVAVHLVVDEEVDLVVPNPEARVVLGGGVSNGT